MVLVSHASFKELSQLEHILAEPVRTDKPLIIIGEFEKNFTEAFISNVSKGTIKGCLMTPAADVGADQLRDLAKLLGGIYFDNANGNTFDYVSENYWGYAKEAIIGFGFCLFSLDSNDHVQDEIKELRAMLEEADPAHHAQIKSRLTMLNGKQATIKIGAATQAAALEIKDRADDAVFAVGSAQKMGYLPGGGVALRDASLRIEDKKEHTPYAAGYNFLLKAINAPYNTILSNAGIKGTELPYGKGYDASTGKAVYMVKNGIIDPAFVTIQSVMNATSSSTALLSAKAVLTLVKDESN